MNLPIGFRHSIASARRALFEVLGSARYSRLSLNGLDRKLERHLDFNGGFFVEAGANDGLKQSNTYYFERMRGWTGLLIEAEPTLAEICRKNRRVPVIHAALVAENVAGAMVQLHYADLMSTIDGAIGDADATARHIQSGLIAQGLQNTRTVSIPARSLSALFDEARISCSIDLLSLDVEGAEPAALRGIDFTRHAPRMICVEARDSAAISDVLEPRYKLVEVLTDYGAHRDLLYGLK